MNEPRLESRVRTVEKGLMTTFAQIEELIEDNRTRFEQITEHLRKIDSHLEETDARLDRIEATMVTKDDIANMATKDDITNMVTRTDLINMAAQIIEAFSKEMDKHVLRYHQA